MPNLTLKLTVAVITPTLIFAIAAATGLPLRSSPANVASLRQALVADSPTAVATAGVAPPVWTHVCLTDRTEQLEAASVTGGFQRWLLTFSNDDERNWWLQFFDGPTPVKTVQFNKDDVNVIPHWRLPLFKGAPPPIVLCADAAEAFLARHPVSSTEFRLFLTNQNN